MGRHVKENKQTFWHCSSWLIKGSELLTYSGKYRECWEDGQLLQIECFDIRNLFAFPTYEFEKKGLFFRRTRLATAWLHQRMHSGLSRFYKTTDESMHKSYGDPPGSPPLIVFDSKEEGKIDWYHESSKPSYGRALALQVPEKWGQDFKDFMNFLHRRMEAIEDLDAAQESRPASMAEGGVSNQVFGDCRWIIQLDGLPFHSEHGAPTATESGCVIFGG